MATTNDKMNHGHGMNNPPISPKAYTNPNNPNNSNYNNQSGGNQMDNTSSLNATEIAVGGLLAGGYGRGGYGYGGGGGAWGGGWGGGGFGPWASPSANAVRLNRNAQQIENQADCTRDMIQAGNIGTLQAFENATRDRQFTDLRDGQFRAELRTADKLDAQQINALRDNADIRQQLADCCCDNKVLNLEAQLRNQECCCETQKQILALEAGNNLKFAAVERQACEDKSQILAEIKAVESRNIERQLNAANAELTALKTQVACGCTTGCCRPCHPHHP